MNTNVKVLHIVRGSRACNVFHNTSLQGPYRTTHTAHCGLCIMIASVVLLSNTLYSVITALCFHQTQTGFCLYVLRVCPR